MQQHEIGVRTSLKIDEVRIFPLDILPKFRRMLPIGAISYGAGGSWAGRSALVAISAEGLTGWGEIRPVIH